MRTHVIGSTHVRTMSFGSMRTFMMGCDAVLFMNPFMGHVWTEIQGKLRADEWRPAFPDGLRAGILARPCIRSGRPRSMRARRRTASPRKTCSRAVVQFLDETVAFAGFRLSRDSRWPAPFAAHLYLRLHQRRLRAGAGVRRAGGTASGSGGARG